MFDGVFECTVHDGFVVFGAFLVVHDFESFYDAFQERGLRMPVHVDAVASRLEERLKDFEVPLNTLREVLEKATFQIF